MSLVLLIFLKSKLFDNYSFNEAATQHVGLFQTLQSSAKAAMSVEKLSSKRKLHGSHKS